MTVTGLPRTWVAPDWHPDLGDAKGEFEHLRALAEAILEEIGESSIDLEIAEPGLMYLAIILPNGVDVEVHSVACERSGDRSHYGIFSHVDTSSEEEVYAETVAEAVRLVISLA